MAPWGHVETNRILAAGGLLAVLIGLWLAVTSGLDEGETSTAGPAPPQQAAPASPPAASPPARPRAAPLVALRAAGAYDPEGDGRERDEEAGLAVDGRRDTAWRTERYSNFFKSGVGLVLDLGRTRRVERVVVDSPTAGRASGDPPRKLARGPVHEGRRRARPRKRDDIRRRPASGALRRRLGHRRPGRQRDRGGRGARPRSRLTVRKRFRRGRTGSPCLGRRSGLPGGRHGAAARGRAKEAPLRRQRSSMS